jgi:glucose-6-phosphate dehydrogenase assembly protein OpcA
MSAPSSPNPPASASDATWSEQGTTPEAIAAAVRDLVRQLHSENGGLVPARALNMIAFVDRRFAGEVANRLSRVGRFHASRTIVFSYEPGRESLDARAVVSSELAASEGELGLLRETLVVEIGEHHLDDLVTIADPLVVSDITTLLWSPHGHGETADPLLGLAQVVLVDSREESSFEDAIARSCALSKQAYVVDLAWLRSIPWRERIAAAFDPPAMRDELDRIETVSVRHHPSSTVAAMLLVGWLGSRLGWTALPLKRSGEALHGIARNDGREIELHLEPACEQQVPGLQSVAIATASGRRLGLRRGEGGLRARSRDGAGREREWTILGASRGESGILGEGIRQALLREPTYVPTLRAVEAMVP